LNRFESLIVDEIPALRRYARALCRDPVAADDLVQEALVRAVSRQKLWVSHRGMRPWLFTILHNIFVNSLRGRRVLEVSEAVIGESDSASSEQDADYLCALSDFEQALFQLSSDQREVLLLVGLEQLTYRQVARVTGVPVGTVMSRLARAREQLSRSLEGEIRLANIKRVK